jgi:uncharacterized protein YcfL
MKILITFLAFLVLTGCSSVEHIEINSATANTNLKAIKSYQMLIPSHKDEVAVMACYEKKFKKWNCHHALFNKSIFGFDQEIEFYSRIDGHLIVKTDSDNETMSFNFTFDETGQCKETISFKPERNDVVSNGCYYGYKKYNHQDHIEHRKILDSYSFKDK